MRDSSFSGKVGHFSIINVEFVRFWVARSTVQSNTTLKSTPVFLPGKSHVAGGLQSQGSQKSRTRLSDNNSPCSLQLEKSPHSNKDPAQPETESKQIERTLLKQLQFRSVAQSCPTLCNPMNRSTPSLPVHHQLLEFTQTHGHRVGDAIKPSHPLSSPSPPALNPSQHQSLFQ